METDPAVCKAIAAAFNVKQELYFTVREGHSMTMSVEAVRRMPQKEIAGLWRSYVEALARCMVSSCMHKAWGSWPGNHPVAGTRHQQASHQEILQHSGCSVCCLCVHGACQFAIPLQEAQLHRHASLLAPPVGHAGKWRCHLT